MQTLLPKGVQTKCLKLSWLKIVSIDTGGAPWAANRDNQGLGENRFMKKPEVKNLVELSL